VLEDAALKRGGDKVISVTAQVQDGHSEDALLTSNGFEGSSELTYFVNVAQMTRKTRATGGRRPTPSGSP